MPDARPEFKRLLMLQGPAGPFFWLLARRLRRQGVTVHKVNLNAGDALFFPGPGARFYRGRPEGWPDYLAGLIAELDIDAIALFGDCRTQHRQAIAVAVQKNIPILAFEEGYLRPDHITVELGGVNGHSRIARQGLPPIAVGGGAVVPVGNAFPAMAIWAMLHTAAKDAGWAFFPHFQHRRANSVIEALAHLRSGLRKIMHRDRDRRQLETVKQSGKPYFLLPLQIHNDSQITEHSPFLSVAHLAATVIRSFAAHAPLNTMLLIKHHPLDRGHCCYHDLVERTAEAAGCPGRVIYFTEGHLPSLLAGAAGTVTCNSTVGLSALWHGTPVKTLGRAVYNKAGLTAQCSLDAFWAAAPPVDRNNLSAFAAFLKATSQANGSFYTGYRRTGVMDSVIVRMAAQYKYATSARIIARPRDLPSAPIKALAEAGGGKIPMRLFSTGAVEGAE